MFLQGVKKVNEIYLFLIGVQEQRKGDQANYHKFSKLEPGKNRRSFKGVKKVSHLFE
jgi:hypothetical protein